MPAQLIHNREQFWRGGLQYQCNCTGVLRSDRSCIAQGLQHGRKEWRQERSWIHRRKYIVYILILLVSFWSVISSDFPICMEHILNLGSPFGYVEKELLPALHFHSFYWSSLTHQSNSNRALPSKGSFFWLNTALIVFNKCKNLGIFAGQLYFSTLKKTNYVLWHWLTICCTCVVVHCIKPYFIFTFWKFKIWKCKFHIFAFTFCIYFGWI